MRLHPLTDLRMLYLIGNPLMLAPSYRNVIKSKLKLLRIFDGTPTLNEIEGGRKKKKPNASSAMGGYSLNPPPVDLNALVADVNENFTLDLHFRHMAGIDGIYLTEETCKLEILDTLT